MTIEQLNSLLDKEVVVAWSGGLDSTGLIVMLLEEYHCHVYPLFIKRGQTNFKYEKRAVKKYDKLFMKRYPLLYENFFQITAAIPPKELKDSTSGTFHNQLRNSDIINQATRYALSKGIEIVLLGSVPSDNCSWKDGSSDYFRIKTEEVRTGIGNSNFMVLAPFVILQYDKSQILKMTQTNGVDLSSTRSCFKDTASPCGECGACEANKMIEGQT